MTTTIPASGRVKNVIVPLFTLRAHDIFRNLTKNFEQKSQHTENKNKIVKDKFIQLCNIKTTQNKIHTHFELSRYSLRFFCCVFVTPKAKYDIVVCQTTD